MVVKHGILTLTKERRLRVFENRILRQIFAAKRDGNGEWRSLHNEEIHTLYLSHNIVRAIKTRRLRWAVHVARMIIQISSFLSTLKFLLLQNT